MDLESEKTNSERNSHFVSKNKIYFTAFSHYFGIFYSSHIILF